MSSAVPLGFPFFHPKLKSKLAESAKRRKHKLPLMFFSPQGVQAVSGELSPFFRCVSDHFFFFLGRPFFGVFFHKQPHLACTVGFSASVPG